MKLWNNLSYFRMQVVSVTIYENAFGKKVVIKVNLKWKQWNCNNSERIRRFHPYSGWGIGQKGPRPYQFFPLTSTNAGISLWDFLDFSFNPFATLV